MPRFSGKPIVVEAHQFFGNLGDLPLNFAAELTQPILGETAYLSSTVMRYQRMDGDDENVTLYSRGDVVNVYDWIILGLSGFYRMGPGEFESAFAEVPDEVASGGEGAQVTYIGAPGDSVPVLHWLGYKFPYMRPIGVSNPEHLARIRNNSHFVVEDTQENDGDGGAVGSEGATQAGAGDSASVAVDYGPDDVRSIGLSDAGLAGVEYTDPRSFTSYPAPKRGPGRPGRADSAGLRT